MKNNFQYILSKIKNGEKLVAVLVDPDKASQESCKKLSLNKNVDLFFVGGSLLNQNNTFQVVKWLKNEAKVPVILFPGSSNQIVENADALLFLSLISGRNPDLLIGQHVAIAPQIRNIGLETISTGYMLVDSGNSTTALYMSQTQPIPTNKPEIAVATALAGEMLGLKQIYMDGGSGADNPISSEMISEVKKSISIPLIVGGGLNTKEKIQTAFNSGADIVVVGNKLEEDPSFLDRF